MFVRSVLIAVVGCGISLVSQAETFTVTEGDSLGDAIEAALANDEADVIEIAPGTYFNTNRAGEVFTIVGEDDITIRGTDPENRPIIFIEPNLEEEFLPVATFDGIVVQMAGSIRFEHLIFLPTENFTLEPDVANMISFVDHGTPENPSTLDAFFDHVLITDTNENNEPITTTGFDDPAIGVLNTTRQDGISFHEREPDAVDPDSGEMDDTANLTLRNTVITISSPDGGHTVDYAVPNGTLTILEGCIFSFAPGIGLQNREYARTVIRGTEEQPVIFWGADGSRPVNIWDGENEWDHVWIIGDAFPADINVRFSANSGGPRIENRAESLIARNCIFANYWVYAVWGRYQFNSLGDTEAFPDTSGFTPRTFVFEHCTFFNVPLVFSFGAATSLEQPVPSEITFRDCIFDPNGIPSASSLPVPGVEILPPDNVFIHHTGNQLPVNLNTTVVVDTAAHNADGIFSDLSPGDLVTATGTFIDRVNFGFKETVFSMETLQDYLVPTNGETLSGLASDGTALDGARTGDFDTSVLNWNLF